MENAAEALKMAAEILIFVLALSISINAFGEVRQVSNILIQYKDREYAQTYIDEVPAAGTRKVGIETVIPTVSRAFNENIKIVFKGLDEGVYKITDSVGTVTKIDYIDLKELNLSEKEANQFIMATLYGTKYTDFDNVSKNFYKNKRITLNGSGIYDKINGKEVTEKTGIYYVEEVPKEGQAGQENVPDANKTKKRVVTYEI